ncbi:hypothetical protein F3Y22_tig00110657pilonHSYRG00025 [Hibiscus syriacus]|uniref:Uncharacterized protein n=1 Tax=Hibiscus syriacus TaxID=106335 RepID=A0A6A2ZYM5_HIBSY|nr:hypothetical protein F3Y22_tig00110657pilonHSYRG00025 [Hibiscus syriacus]
MAQTLAQSNLGQSLMPGKILFADLCDVCHVRLENDAVKNFTRNAHLSFYDGLGVVVAIVGRTAEVDLRAIDGGYTYSCSKGIRCYSQQAAAAAPDYNRDHMFMSSLHSYRVQPGSTPRPPAAA